MTEEEIEILNDICPNYPKDAVFLREDGSVDFEALFGEFSAEGGDARELKMKWNKIPSHLKRI